MCPTVSDYELEPGEWQSDDAIRQAALEVEAHVAESGWDQPARLYALVPTSELLTAEPEQRTMRLLAKLSALDAWNAIAARLGLDPANVAGTFTPIEQELNPSEPLEDLLTRIEWPPTVLGVAAVLERFVLPADAEETLPSGPGYEEAAAQHPDRHEVRMAAAVTRDGRAHCAIRLREHDHDDAVLDGTELIPGLVGLLARSLTD